MNIVIIGPKGSGKSTVGAAIAEALELPVVETDLIIEELHDAKDKMTYREIYKAVGEDAFRELERQAAAQCAERDWHIILTGGGTFMDTGSRNALRTNALIIYLTAVAETLWERATAEGIPALYEGSDGKEKYLEATTFRDEVMRPFADIILDTTTESPESLAQQACELISQELAIRSRSANTYGDIIRLTTYGESHGKAIGGILDGLRPGLPIDEDAIRVQMERRRPGQSKVVTQRKEADEVEILSGVFEGKTTGAPIGFIIQNTDQRSKNYDDIKDKFRPGHADYTFYKKYGLRDYRGGGRSSARETAVRVGAGAIAMELLKAKGVEFHAHAVEIGDIKAETCKYDVIETNPVRCADPIAAKKMEEAILQVRKEQDSLGGIVQLDILNVPVGLGDPVFAKLDARLTHAIMTIGAIKGVEIGDGFAMTRLHGSETNDNMTNKEVGEYLLNKQKRRERKESKFEVSKTTSNEEVGRYLSNKMDDEDTPFLSNHAGGITGGISTGQTITLRIALKPTASISKEQQSIDIKGDNVPVEVHGRHDPCLVPRAVPVIENMAALTILDAWEIQTRLNPDWEKI